jgi:SAM-dependent methyltransferase
MRALPSVVEPGGHSPKQSWSVIGNLAAARAVEDRLRRAERFDAYRRPELYDLCYPGYPGDASYYLRKGQTGAVLYLGVGTGRIFAPLAGANPEAVGLELSAEMAECVVRSWPALRGRVLRADAAAADLGAGRFDAVFAPYSFLQCLDEASARAVVYNACRWLKPGGILCADTFSPYLIPFAIPGLEASVRIVGGARVAIYVRYDHLPQRLTEHALVERAGAADCVLEMHLRYYFPGELSALFVDAGFEPPRVFGGYAGEPFDPVANEVLVYEARKPGAARGS